MITEKRLHIILINAIIVLEELNYTIEDLEEELGITIEEYNEVMNKCY